MNSEKYIPKNDFRVLHSKIIEHYQFIEAHLEGIYAMISGKDFSDGLADVDKHNISKLVIDLKSVQAKRNIVVLNDEDFERIRKTCERRNFWVHNCYFDLTFRKDRNEVRLKNEKDISQMISDLREAEDLRNELHEKLTSLYQRNQ